MRHMLITIPVAILLSVLACSEEEEEGVVVGPYGVERPRAEGREERPAVDDGLAAALRDGHPNRFVHEAEEALEAAERQLDVVAVRAGAEGGTLRRALQARIAEARADLDRLSASEERDWKELGLQIDHAVQDIQDDLRQLGA